MSDFVRDYRTLGLAPGCSLQTLKAARRRLVIAWHPDRFSGGTGEKARAEERIKDINTAFDRLLEYHRRFGTLPLPAAATPPPVTTAEPTEAAPKPPHADTLATDVARGKRPESAAQSTRIRTSLRWAIAIVFVILFNEGMHTDINNDDSDDSTATTQLSGSLDDESSDVAQPSLAPPAPQRAFAVGSTIDDVYAAQGNPTSTQNGVWYYGKSKVYFTDGVVTGWDIDPANPLNIALSSDVVSTKPRARTFTVGSTKAEVRAVQGVPGGETDTRWDYGLSKIYFRDGRVVSWESSPTHPLKARK